MALGISAIVFLATGFAIFVFGSRRYVRAGQIYRNLETGPASPLAASDSPGVPGFYAITHFVERIGHKLPPSPRTASKFRQELISAGYRSSRATTVYYGLKLTLIPLFVGAALLMQSKLPASPALRMLYVAVAALGAFRLPDFVLARKLRHRQLRLRQALPDALDLMVVCSEAGLALDRTIRTVGRELAVVHPVLSEELNLMSLEVTAGTRRKEALENFAARTQEPEIRKFVTVLIQADRFGTEIAEALRVHAEYLRMRRRLDAEDRAGRVSVKLVFPIFLFILPCMLLVTLGPAAIEIWKVLLPAIHG